MKPIRLDFCDFWPGFSKTENFFVEVLSSRFKVEISDKPDFVIFADAKKDFRRYTCPRIFFSGEQSAANFDECDYALTCRHMEDPRHLRLPLYVLYVRPEALVKDADAAERDLLTRPKFCGFVVTNGKCRERTDFFKALAARRQVDSGGRFMNNVGGPVEDKLQFLRNYRFNLAFENARVPGYTTEKLIEAAAAGCIPIYWGNPTVSDEFNPASFIDRSAFKSDAEAIDHILRVADDESRLRQYAREPFFHGNKPNEYFDRERVVNFFEEIFLKPIQPVGARRPFFSFGKLLGR